MKKQKLNEKGVPYGARQKMPLWYAFAWSSRGVSNALNILLIGYVTYYCTDMLSLSPVTVGVMLMASKVIDAVTDICAGYIIDHTHTKLGKGRPYEFFIILQWVFAVLMFNVPDMSNGMKYVYVFIMYVLVNAICSTMLGAEDSVYLARTFTTEKNRITAISINGFVVMIASIIFNILLPQLIATLGSTKEGWFTLALYIAVPMAIIGILRFILCKEIVTDTPAVESDIKADIEKAETAKPAKNDLPLKTIIGAMLKNKYAWIIIALMFLIYLVNNMGTVTTYYFKYLMGDVSLQSMASMTSLITPVLMIIFPMLSNKFGTTKILKFATLGGIIGLVIRTLGGANMTTILIGGLFFGIGVLPISMMINTYLIDCMDYGEWKTGIRVEGMIASVSNFAGKLGSAVASGLTGLLMGLAGYNGDLEVQSASANGMIVILYNVLPLVLFVVMFILVNMYKMDDIKDEMKADLEKRHSGQI